ncbi:MAG TPA: HD domain-containing phosphohydrolase [Longimicrobiales bacterium]|nr:HD domain-containing phosphohydrolase [Longimicrobiales bacterium]
MDASRILILEDEEPLIALLERILRAAGYAEVRSLTDPRQALPVLRAWQPDLILTDLHMPHMDGIAVMQQLLTRNPSEEFLPVIMITGDDTAEAKQRALAAGASDFLSKPFEASDVVVRIRNLLALRRTQRELREAIERSDQEVQRARVDAVTRLGLIASYRAAADGSHPTRVGDLSAHIARALVLPDAEVERIRLAAPLHDVGMVAIPESIVNKAGSLSLDELDLIKTHTSLGARMLANSESPIMQLAEEIALYHHEAWDGSGYTPGLSGAAIPLAARIVAVADTFYAMVGKRPYQEPFSVDAAVAWIEGQAGRRFDPEVVQAFKRVCSTHDLPLLDDRQA